MCKVKEAGTWVGTKGLYPLLFSPLYMNQDTKSQANMTKFLSDLEDTLDAVLKNPNAMKEEFKSWQTTWVPAFPYFRTYIRVLEKENAELKKENDALHRYWMRTRNAFMIEGSHPEYHRKQKELLKKNWETLHDAVSNNDYPL